MASGHVNRIKRPDTWLHRPMLQNVKKVLANPEPSTHGTKRTCCRSHLMSVVGGRTDLARITPRGLTLTQNGHRFFQAETDHSAVAATANGRALRLSKSMITSWGHLSAETLAG
jgi:hypothetical protein